MAININIGPETDEGIKITIYSKKEDEKRLIRSHTK